jgi:hypothetical protein
LERAVSPDAARQAEVLVVSAAHGDVAYGVGFAEYIAQAAEVEGATITAGLAPVTITEVTLRLGV